MASIVIPASFTLAQLLISGAAGTYVLSNLGRLVPGFATPPKTSAPAEGGKSLEEMIAQTKSEIDATADTPEQKAAAKAALDALPGMLAKLAA
jgi:hypothetical protein